MRSNLSTKSFRNCPCLHPSKHTIFFAAPGMLSFSFHYPPYSSSIHPHLFSVNHAARLIDLLKSGQIITVVVLLSRKSILYHRKMCMGYYTSAKLLHFVSFSTSLIVPSAKLFVLQIKTCGKTVCKKKFGWIHLF